MDKIPQVTVGRRGRSPLFLILLILFIIASAAAVYFYLQFVELSNNPQKVAQAEIDETVAKVGKLMFLPENEEPTVALITDPQALAGQPFFAKAKKGDWVLIYPNAGRAILFDSVANKIIDVGPVNIGQSPTR